MMPSWCAECGSWLYRKVPHTCSPRLGVTLRACRWEFGGEVYASQGDAVRAAESLYSLLWGPVPSLLRFAEA